jgi:hypothetical protein
MQMGFSLKAHQKRRVSHSSGQIGGGGGGGGGAGMHAGQHHRRHTMCLVARVSSTRLFTCIDPTVWLSAGYLYGTGTKSGCACTI